MTSLLSLPLSFAFAFTSEGGSLPAGPPVVHLERTPAAQWRFSSSVGANSLRDLWGAQTHLRWDERNATIRFAGFSGVAEADADLLASDLASVSGVDPEELSLVGITERHRGNGTRQYLRYSRQFRGVNVLGDEILLVVTNGRIGAAWVRLTQISPRLAPVEGEVILPDARGFGRLATEERLGPVVRYLDRRGTLLLAYDSRRFGSLSVVHDEFTVGDPLVTHAARRVGVEADDGTSDRTDDSGVHSLETSASAVLSGDELRVLQSGASIRADVEAEDELVGGEDLSLSAAAMLHHFWEVRDWVEGYWPTLAWLPEQVRADVDLNTGSCNAYYTGGTINFYAENEACNATGRIASVIYHEYGHGIHDYIRAGGSFASDVSEGSADYVSATLLDDPEISRGFYVDGSSIRELDTDRVYPADMIGESHNDGLIWGSFLWNLRSLWADTESDGVAMTDLLFLEALEQGPELTDLMEAVLVADDDDGDWTNGTPHDCELLALLDVHGLGPGGLGVTELSHTPIEAQASATSGYTIDAVLSRAFESCTGSPELEVAVYYSTDESVSLPLADGTGFENWSRLALTSSDDLNYRVKIPRLPANSVVKYFLGLESTDGSAASYSHRGVEEDAFRFWVGDQKQLTCVDFESGASGFVHGGGIPWEGSTEGVDEWSVGTPAGTGAYDPDEAYSGSSILTTGMDIEYLANNATYLQTPTVDLTSAGMMRLLTYRRWLTVEDAKYDQSRIVALDAAGQLVSGLWSNPATTGGTTHLLDLDWTERSHSLANLLGTTGSRSEPLAFGYSLRTDGGLEYGGWALDDWCVTELNDPPAHYRAANLVVSWTDPGTGEPEGVGVAWNTPWIRPLSTTVLVRKEGGWPLDLDDGVILDLDLAPRAGETKSIVDELPGLDRGTTWYYALLAVGRDGGDDLYLDVVEGENGAALTFAELDTGSVDTAEIDSGETDDSADPEPESPTDTGEEPSSNDCGCSSGSAPLSAVAAGFALLGLRRRR